MSEGDDKSEKSRRATVRVTANDVEKDAEICGFHQNAAKESQAEN